MKPTKLTDLLEDGKFKGQWELGPNHEVLLKSGKDSKDIRFRGSLIGAEPDTLVVAVTERTSAQKTVTRLVHISGAWKLNAKNQIIFEVGRKSGASRTLTFTGSWKVGKTNEIIYTYERGALKTKTKEHRELIFKGLWDISEKNRLTYSLGGDSNSAFKIRGTFQTKSILAKKGEIKYQAGVEAIGKHKIQTITLFGKWKVSRDLGIHFEMEYEGLKRKAIIFGGEFALGARSTIEANLKSRSGDPLGIELIFTKEFMKDDGQLFLRLERSLEESRIEAGARIKL